MKNKTNIQLPQIILYLIIRNYSRKKLYLDAKIVKLGVGIELIMIIIYN